MHVWHTLDEWAQPVDLRRGRDRCRRCVDADSAFQDVDYVGGSEAADEVAGRGADRPNALCTRRTEATGRSGPPDRIIDHYRHELELRAAARDCSIWSGDRRQWETLLEQSWDRIRMRRRPLVDAASSRRFAKSKKPIAGGCSEWSRITDAGLLDRQYLCERS